MIFALGAFDGFHMGHQQLLRTAEERAGKTKTSWGVVTFDGHPQMLFNKESFRFLFSENERDLLACYYNIPQVVKIPFSRTLADMLPGTFLDLISEANDITGLVVGENFRFGRARLGTPDFLRAECRSRGWSFDQIDPFRIEGEVVSSTAIREQILRGGVKRADRFLGHPFIVSGKVVRGDGRGRQLGYPTANLMIEPNKLYPARGSYSALAFLNGRWHPVALNVGYNPTFDGARGMRCEAHIADFNQDIYGEKLILFVVDRNRDEMKFSGEQALREQLKKDVTSIKMLAARYLEERIEILSGFEKFLL